MKIRIFITLTAVFVLALLVFIAAANWNKHLIFLVTGDVIEADKTWVVFDDVYYEKGLGTFDTVNTRQVERIVHAGFSSPEEWKIILSYEMKAGRGGAGVLLSPLLWLSILAAGVFYLMTIMLRKILRHQNDKKSSKRSEPDFRVIRISSGIPDFEKVVLYFLNLYLLQLKSKKNDKYAYQRLDHKGSLNTSVYEYKIFQKGFWRSRKISIGIIGDASGARSKCFHVIYDDHFVVKIPPEPLTDFEQYLQSIQADRRIADILSPRECLVPKVSVVFKKLPGFATRMEKFAGDDETKCIKCLKAFPEFKEFLKIGGSYAFYMDLSKHFFLDHILRQIHDTADSVSDEINTQQEKIWIPDAFASRYGEDTTDICFKLQNVYRVFDEQLKDPSTPEFQKKSWFIKILQDKKIFHDSTDKVKKDRDTAKPTPPEVEAAILKIKNQHSGTLNEYRNLMQQFVQNQSFKQNSNKIQNICSRLIELLAGLFLKNVAIRDLKPDNLLVAGDPSKYPQFLSTPDGFELGLIDVEIAASVGTRDVVDQPKLGWTPFYATPSHMFVNNVLKDLYDDIGYILKLQDWYAVVAMIYQTITGKKIFTKTAAIISAMGKELPLYFDNQSAMKTFANRSATKFWNSAAEEFESKLAEDKERLESVNIEIIKNAVKMFKVAAEKSEHEYLQIQLAGQKSPISAFDLIQVMFEHIRETMLEHMRGGS